ncbi:MAG: fluoride efflux transporter CrcB [Nocardioidaceae bacterium]
MTLLLVILGGAVGAPLRYLTDQAVNARHASVFPFGTLAVNATGSLVLGFVAGLASVHAVPAWVLALLGTGFCGALTTFSTFGYETVRLVEDGSFVEAALNVVVSLGVGLVAVLAGWGLAIGLG